MKKIENNYRKFLVERLSSFRVEVGLSARELSNRIGKSDGYIGKFEMGGINIPSEILLDALTVLEVSPEKFFSEDPKNFDENNAIVCKWKRLSEENKKLVAELIDKLK